VKGGFPPVPAVPPVPPVPVVPVVPAVPPVPFIDPVLSFFPPHIRKGDGSTRERHRTDPKVLLPHQRNSTNSCAVFKPKKEIEQSAKGATVASEGYFGRLPGHGGCSWAQFIPRDGHLLHDPADHIGNGSVGTGTRPHATKCPGGVGRSPP